MWKRPHQAKTSAPLRSSDARKLRDHLAAAFPLADPRAAPATAKAILPDGTLAAKGTSHLGDPFTAYLAPPSSSSLAPDPRIVRIGKGDSGPLVPTCYALDLCPDLLPALETAPAVVPNLVSGSALFAAGVSPRSLAALPATAKEGDLVAIVVAADPPSRRAVAVGHLAADRDTLVRMQKGDGEKKGKAVITIHARGDFLWQSGSGIEADLPPVREREPTAAELADELAASSLDDGAEPAASASSSAAAPPAPAPPSSSTEPAPTATSDLSPADVDALLLSSLLQALSSTLPSASFPLPASLLYSAHILPSRPASVPRDAIELKRSASFRKLDRLVKAAVKRGWIAAKETRGEWVVVGVNEGHEDVQQARPYRTAAVEEKAAAAAAARGEEEVGDEAAEGGVGAKGKGKGREGEGTEVRELWKLSGDGVKELFRSVEHERPAHDLYTSSHLSTLLRRFTDAHSLSHPSHRALLLLAPTSHPSPSSLSPAQLAAMDLLARVVLRKGEVAEQVGSERGAPGKGSPPTIRVQIKNVGKRQVTLVSGHEPWDLFTSDELAEELKHRSASSTSIQPIAGSAKKGSTPKVEIMCQGTHDALVTKLLAARGVPKAFIEVDTSKSKK
ncbi:hypothetical protein Rhopal_006873-T1 [Rhodotorula paludigena]|uniref:SUI1 domain-containing protein n=1 Tax=Rhodotorula paludigena TaxID=86838 RepID=A0AAV5GMK1_9BASI|nr:hypothetical protein Rhopal_006873-T1 [Rhodotorula paludigena]